MLIFIIQETTVLEKSVIAQEQQQLPMHSETKEVMSLKKSNESTSSVVSVLFFTF